MFPRPENPYHQVGDPRFPHVVTTYRLTEHLTGGGMTRWVPWLAELQPHGFCEIGPGLTKEIGVNSGYRVVISTPRSEIELPALVTERMQPLRIDGKLVHHIGLPWHFSFGGLATGATANELSALVQDPNSRIHEGKSFTCNVRRRE